MMEAVVRRISVNGDQKAWDLLTKEMAQEPETKQTVRKLSVTELEALAAS